MEKAEFIDRSTCIACGSAELADLASGPYDGGTVGAFMRADPWGEDPLPFLAGSRWQYVKCTSCGQAFHRKVLNAEWNERRFTRWMSNEAIATFEAAIKTPHSAFEKGARNTGHILSLEQLTRKSGRGAIRLLDFGCGYGEFLANCTLFGFDAVGVDRSAARRANSLTPIVAELADVAGPFDVVTMFEVLEHLDEPRTVLQLLTELLVPGGILVLETPDCSGVSDIKSHEDYRKIHPLEHINGFTPSTMRQLAVRLGYEQIARPVAHVTTDIRRLVKGEVKRHVRKFLTLTTQQYFRKTASARHGR